MFPYRIEPAALADLGVIADFIGRDDVQRAESFAEELVSKIEIIA